MRTLLLAAACGLAACTVEGGKDVPLVTGDGPLSVDPGTQQVKIDSARVPVLTSCSAGQIVRRSADGWECVVSRVPWANVDGAPATFPPSAHTHPSAQITDFADAVAAVATSTPLSNLTVSGPIQHAGSFLDRRQDFIGTADGSYMQVLRGGARFDARVRVAWDAASEVGWLVARVAVADASSSLNVESLSYSGALPWSSARLMSGTDGLMYLELDSNGGVNVGQLTYTLLEGEGANLLDPQNATATGSERLSVPLAGLAQSIGRVQVLADGSIKSPRFKATKVLDRVNTNNLSGTLTTSGGTLILFASGSAYNNAGTNYMQVDVRVNNVTRGDLRGFTNEPGSHKQLTSNPIVLTGLAAGTHTVSLVLTAGNYDTNDYFNVTALELPF